MLAVLLTGGEGRVYLDWDPAVVTAARAVDDALDPNGHVAPVSMLNE